MGENKKKTVNQIVSKNPNFLTSLGFLKEEVLKSMEFSNKKDKEFFNNSKTLIQKNLLTPVTDFKKITKQTAAFFYSFTNELLTTEKQVFSKTEIMKQVEKCKEIDIFFFHSLDLNLKNHPKEHQIVRNCFMLYKMQGYNVFLSL